MAYIPFEKMKTLREAAKSGDERARKIIIMQMNGEDFGSLLDQYFEAPNKTEEVINKGTYSDTTEDSKLNKFLEYNGVKKGDMDYDSTVEAYYKEFPKERKHDTFETKATESDSDNTSIYGEEDEPIEDDQFTKEKQLSMHHGLEEDIFSKLMGEEIDAIRSYGDAILKIMSCEKYNDNEKKGIIEKLEEIRRDEQEHWSELKHLKEISFKREMNNM